MKNSLSSLSWQRNKITYTFALAFIPIVVVLWVIPPHYSWYFWQRNLQTVAKYFFGFFSLFTPTVGLSRSLSDQFQLLSVLWVGLAGILIGLFIQMMWRTSKKNALILFVIHIVFGFPFANFSGDFVRHPVIRCDEQISESQRIKIIGFDDLGSYKVSFFVSTINSGESWQQFMASPHDGLSDSKPIPTCKNIRHFDEEFIWVWTTYAVGVSQDGGDTWHVWQLSCGRNVCDYGSVLDVTFVNKRNGTITAWRSGSNAEISTTDGGITWTLE